MERSTKIDKTLHLTDLILPSDVSKRASSAADPAQCLRLLKVVYYLMYQQRKSP